MIEKKDIVFRFGISHKISYNEKYFCCVKTSSCSIYDITTGDKVKNLTGIRYLSYTKFLSDDKLLVKNTIGNYHIYDLISGEMIWKFNTLNKRDPQDSCFQVTPDEKYIIDFVYFFPHNKLFILEINSGKYELYDLGNSTTCRIFYDPEQSKYYIAANSLKNQSKFPYTTFFSFSYPIDKIEVKKMPIQDVKSFGNMDYLKNRFTFNHYKRQTDCQIVIYDMKKNISEEFDLKKKGYCTGIKWSKNGKYIVLTQSEVIQIYDAQKKICIKEFDIEYGSFADFYDNDTKLLIGTWKKGYCINIEPYLNA